jgi:hypothetical protein
MIWDGINTQAVKTGSTPPVAADPAAVVALSPNSLAADDSANGSKLPVLAARATAAAPTFTEGRQNPLSVDLAGNMRSLLSSWFGSAAPTVGQKTMAASIPVVFPNNQTAIPVASATAGTPATVGKAASSTSITLLAANPNRLGAIIHNDATSAPVYVRLGAGAAATSGNYTTFIQPGGCYEVPFHYTGIIDGIWTAATGFANVTELTA